MPDGGTERELPNQHSSSEKGEKTPFIDKHYYAVVGTLVYVSAEAVVSVLQNRWLGAARSVIEFTNNQLP